MANEKSRRNNAPPQILILLWHHFCYYKRHWFKLIIIILLPIVLILLLYFLCNALTVDVNTPSPARSRSEIDSFSGGPLHFVLQKYCKGFKVPDGEGPRGQSLFQFGWNMPLLEQLVHGNGNKVECANKHRDYYDQDQKRINRALILLYPNSSSLLLSIVDKMGVQLEGFSRIEEVNSNKDNGLDNAQKVLVGSALRAKRQGKGIPFVPVKDRILAFASRKDAHDFVRGRIQDYIDSVERKRKEENKTAMTESHRDLLADNMDWLWGIVGFEDSSNQQDDESNINYRLIPGRNADPSQIVHLQSLVENAIIMVNCKECKQSPPMTALYRDMPSKCRARPADYAYMTLQYLVPMICVLSFLPIGINFLEQVITEKWLKLREYMYIQGVGNLTLKFSWMLFYLLFLVPLTIVFAAIFSNFPYIFVNSDVSSIFILLLLYNISQLAFCFLIAAAFQTPRRSGLLYAFIFIFVYIFCSSLFTHSLDMTATTVVLARVLSLHCAMPMCLGVGFIIDWERDWSGATWSRAMLTTSGKGLYGGFGECMLWLVFDTVLYIVLAWYIEHISPGDYGVKYKPWFFLTPSYWCPNCFKNDLSVDFGQHTADVEAVSPSAVPGIAISNMSKAYTSEKVGLRNLNLNFYQGEITAFLGQNGAGKSTTMNSLVGLISPTSGDASVGGFDIRTQMDKIRPIVGFVPQYDILYPSLTVGEHLQFFGWLKGFGRQETLTIIRPLLEKIGLHEHWNATVTTMSGGQKRKLSVLTAYLGEPDVVILDEPTSGVDPYSRRAIWDLILEAQHDGTTILSTHHMEEADVLGQRIAIINDGSLKTFGTPMFLKNKYGLGFKLIIAATDDSAKTEIKSFVHERIPDSKLIQESGNDLNFSIPLTFSRSDQMISVLQAIETNQSKLQIASFGISEPTMEEIFFAATGMKRMMNQHSEHEPESSSSNEIPSHSASTRLTLVEKNGEQTGDTSEIEYREMTSVFRFFAQFAEFFLKRLRYAIRSISGLVFQIILPVVFIALYLLIGQSAIETTNKAEPLTVWQKPHQKVFFVSGDEHPKGLWLSGFVSEVLDHGFGPRCPDGLGGGKCDGLAGKWSKKERTIQLISPVPKNCSCFESCPFPTNVDKVASSEIPSGDLLYDLGTNNISQWVTHLNRSDKVFVGGFQVFRTDKEVLRSLLKNGVIDKDWISSVIDTMADNYVVVYAEPQFMNAMVNIYSNTMLKWVSQNHRRSIVATFEVLDLGGSNYANKIAEVLQTIFGSLFISLAFGFALLGVANFIQYENSTGLKRLQIMAGGSRLIYWLANFVFDFFQFLVTLAIIAILLAVVKNGYQDLIVNVLQTMIPYGLCGIAMTYVLSFLFSDAGGIIRLQIITLFISLIAAVVLGTFASINTLCEADDISEPCQYAWAAVVVFICDIFPFYYAVDCLVSMATLKSIQALDPGTLVKLAPDGVSGQLCPKIGVALGTTLILFLIVIFLEFQSVQLSLACDCCGGCSCCRCCCCKRKPEPEQQIISFGDRDVLAEKDRVLLSENENNSLVVKDITKRYNNAGRPAVDGISFGVNKAECFGLLGINGAGKTTLFRMITGYLKPTHGSAAINDVTFRNRRLMMNEMNYCPQENILFDLLTPEEHLNLFATLHGVPTNQRREYVRNLADDVGLLPHMKKHSTELSGGNQRKLQFAISLLDYRSVMFLDEPTTGLDPGSRRMVWSCIQNAIEKRGCSVVLTSHSMDECEALCNRLVIMIAGQLRCIGSVQYLKDKFGNQYTFKIKSAAGKRASITASVEDLEEYVVSRLPLAKMVEQHSNVMSFKVPADNLRLSALFQILKEAKQSFPIEDFTVTQTTLEHVFVNMAETQQTIESGLEVNLDADGHIVMKPPPSYNQVITA